MKDIREEKNVKKIKKYLEIFYEDLLLGLDSEYEAHYELENYILNCKLEKCLKLNRNEIYYIEEIKFIYENMRMVNVENDKLMRRFFSLYDVGTYKKILEMDREELALDEKIGEWLESGMI